jgi:hypothetical protein
METNRGIRANGVIAHQAPLYAVLADPNTGHPHIFRPETADDVWLLASYGAAITGFSRPLEYKGLPVTDGYFSTAQLPISWMVQREQPTDILVFAGSHYINEPKPSSLVEQALYCSGLAKASKPVRELIKTRYMRFMNTAAEAVSRSDVRVCIVWVPEKLSPVKINQHKSRQLIRLGFQTMEALFKQRHL